MPVTVPLTEIRPIDGALDELAAALGERPDGWLVVTSANGARLVSDHPAAAGRRSAAVGSRTAAVLRDAGLDPVVGSDHTATGLAERMGEEPVGHAVLAVAAAADDRLADALGRYGWTIRRVDLYTTERRSLSEPELAALTGADVVTFFAPSAARAWVDAGLGAPRRSVSIGPTTSTALTELGMEPTTEADEQSVDGVVAAVATLISEDQEEQ